MKSVLKTPAPKGGGYAWYVAGLLSLTHLVSFLDRFIMGLVLVPVKQTFGLSDTQLGLLHGTGFVILYVVAALPLGRLADTGNRRNLIIGGIVFWSLATAACGLAGSFGSLFAARIGVGLGEASLVPAAMSLLAAYFSRGKLGRAVGAFTMGASLGMSAAFIGGGAVLALLAANGGLTLPFFGHLPPWKALFLLTSIPGFLLAFLLLTVREPERENHGAASKPGVMVALRHIGRHDQAYGWHTAAAVAAILLTQSFAAWTPTLFVRTYAMTPAEAGLTVGYVVLITAPLGHLFGGYLTDAFRRHGIDGAPSVVIGLMLAAGVLPALAFCTSHSLAVSIISLGLLKTCLSAASPAGLAGVQMLTPEPLRGVVSALFLAVITLVAVGGGPTLIGIITDQIFKDEQALASSLLTATLIVACFGVIAAVLSRRPVKIAMAEL
ncbi:MAG: MFS transporter [Amphiplicatus sp.]|nr:MFS transporter [Amphiplicatus sp.]HRX40198.1 MFS transporter [Parvularculaceae bacterium]